MEGLIGYLRFLTHAVFPSSSWSTFIQSFDFAEKAKMKTLALRTPQATQPEREARTTAYEHALRIGRA